ncbi:MAG TPA: porin family protein [Chitinophagaceae bacterium]|nr:porin family protein [Chitinophagaceae bacterium]
MNRKISFLLLAMTVTTFSFAQGGFHAGLKGGANVFKVDGKSFEEEFRHGYNLGAFAEINFNKKWGIQPEVMWNQTNTRTSSDFNDIYPHGISDVRDVKLNYLSIPILLSYRPIKPLSLQVGPQFGILIDQDRNLLENGQDAFKRGDFAMVGGAQLNLANFKIGARYQVGLSNINDIDNQDKWKNQGFQAYVGFRIF